MIHQVPYEPILTIERSGFPEVEVEGVVFVSTLKGTEPETILSTGDCSKPLWTRSVLKPWQLMGNLNTLKKAYPELNERHYALMTASHVADVEHLCILRQIIEIGQVSETDLKCPPAKPSAPRFTSKMVNDGIASRALFNNCSGKHLGYLLYLKAHGLPLDNYLDAGGQQFIELIGFLSTLTRRKPDSFPHTTDGCQLPNYALSASEIANAYLNLINPGATHANEDLQKGEEFVSALFTAYPHLISGTDRLDTRIMKGEVANLIEGVSAVAKLGAEGLLAVGIKSNSRFPHGLGILIKLAFGPSERMLEIIFVEVMRRIGLADGAKKEEPLPPHIKRCYHI
jgi:L-asparaginase II